MVKKSKVLFKGKGSGLILVLDKNASYDELKYELIEKVKKSKTFFKGATEDIRFEGKELSSEQENEIAEIITSHAGLEIGFINSGESESFGTKKSDGAKLLLEDDTENASISPVPPTETAEAFSAGKENEPENDFLYNDSNGIVKDDKEEKVLIYNGFVRSGTLVESEGNIVIIGGVNHGGEVFAGENIIVFGQLKGKAVAGRNGGEDSFIAAILMEPELLGICNYVTRFPDSKKDKLYKSPSIARLDANKIVISQAGNFGALK